MLLNVKKDLPIEISLSEAYEKYQQGVFFLDVRSQEEWDQYHLAGSTLIPLEELENRSGELPTNREIVVVCRSGNRSLSGAAILQQAGFRRVTSLTGGLQAWSAAGYAVEGVAP